MRTSICLILIVLACRSDAQMLQVNGRDVFINGMNLPWRFFGKDFGGIARERYDGQYFENTFAQLKEYGVNCVRIWLHCDGRFSPTFDRNGLVDGLPRTFIEDFLDFLARAERHELLVIPVLWTFELADRKSRGDLINSLEKQDSYIENALVPLLKATQEHCNILAWEIMNEPEWAMDIPFGGTTENTYDARAMQQFIGRQANAIHEHSNHRVTVGSAGLRFITNLHFRSHNYWHDTELQAQNIDCSGAYLDFYSVHYYKWSLEPLSPFKQTCAELSLDKPVIVGEFGPSKKKSTLELLEAAHANGYAGTMPWSMNANDGIGSWTDYRESLQRFSHDQTHLMPQFPLCVTNELSHSFISCLLYPNPTQTQLNVHNPNSESMVRIELVSLVGGVVKTWRNLSGDLLSFDVADCPSGSYLARIYSTEVDGTERQRSRQKIMIAR